jgi:hypothetical protein
MTARSARTRGHLLLDIPVGIRVTSRPFVVCEMQAPLGRVRTHRDAHGRSQTHKNGYEQTRTRTNGHERQSAQSVFSLSPSGERAGVRGLVSEFVQTATSDLTKLSRAGTRTNGHERQTTDHTSRLPPEKNKRAKRRESRQFSANRRKNSGLIFAYLRP